MKFTFKTEHPTGRYRSFFSSNHERKLKKKVVGSIGDKSPHEIRLRVKKKDLMEDGNPNCEWKWIKLKKESESITEAKEFLNVNFKIINEKYELWIMD
jgi:hypothetical protein